MKKKNNYYAIMLLIAMSFCMNQVQSQSTSTGNVVVGFPNQPFLAGFDFLGWNAAAPFIALDIQNEQATPIHMHTLAGAGTFNNIRQTILGNYNITGGLIGMGDMNTTAAPFQPQNLLHLHRNPNTFLFEQFTNGTTGNTFNDGFKVGIDPTVTPTNLGALQVALLRQQEVAPMQFWAIDVNTFALFPPGALVNRAEFTSGGAMPPSLIGTGPEDGFRIWNPGYNNSIPPYSPLTAMDFWTGAGNTTHIRFDESGNIDGRNNRFEMVGHRVGLWLDAAPGAGQFAGLIPNMIFNINSNEMGRFNAATPVATNGFMRIGVQPIPAFPVNAVRRLEVFDAANAPQLRITQTGGTVFTDIGTTAAGDLTIFPTNAAGAAKVGINIIAPGNTLEINSNAVAIGPLNSGLKFTDLNNTSGTTPNLGAGVLSVDGTGNVIYVDGAAFGTCPTPKLLTTNAATDLNDVSIYFLDPAVPTNTQKNDIGLGYPCWWPLEAKFDVQSQTLTNHGFNFTHRFAGRFYETGSYAFLGNDEFVGVGGICDVTHPLDDLSINLGGDFIATNGNLINIGARGSTGNLPATATLNVGLWGEVLKVGPTNYGVFGKVIPILGPFCAGVYGYTPIPR